MKSWKNALVGPQASLQEAIAALDRGGLQIAVIVDAQQRILGTLTDGDVRRALLRQQGLQTAVSEVMFPRPQVAPLDSSPETLRHLMERRQLLQIPLVDAEGRLAGIETLQGLLQGHRKNNAVFLMAGGFGKRLHPLTEHRPKPLLNVGDKPILEIIIENFVSEGFYRFFISTHYRSEMIRERIGDGSRWGIEVEYIHEDEPLGTGGALSLLNADCIQEPLFLMNGDLLTKLNFSRLLSFHESNDAVATMCVREHEHCVPYGVIESDGLRITSMVEKPSYRYFINAGIYVLSPAILTSLARGHKVDMPTLLEQQLARGLTVNMFPVQDYWLDIGRLEDFQRAQSEITGLFNG